VLSPPPGSDPFRTEPSEDELAELKRLKEISERVHIKLKSALRLANRYRPKEPKPGEVAKKETLRYAEKALQRIEALAPKGATRYLPDPAKTFPTTVTTVSTVYDDPRRVVLNGAVPPEAYDDPKRVKL